MASSDNSPLAGLAEPQAPVSFDAGQAIPSPRDPVWGGRDVLVLALVALFTLIFCGVVIGIYVAALYPKQKPEAVAAMPVISILAQAFTSSVLFGAMYG